MNRRSRTVEIETPEGVRFSLLLAGPLVRFVAWLIDAIAVIGISQLIGRLLPLVGVIGAVIAQERRRQRKVAPPPEAQ